MRDLLRPIAVGVVAVGLFVSMSRAQNPLVPREPAPGGGGNPLAPKTAQRPFAGSFVGDKISVDLNYDDRQEGYTGWLTFNGARYMCGGFVENSHLVGKFVANGQQFPFSLGINGDGAVLTSEGQNYQLKKQAPPEPAPPPVVGGNPLAGGAAFRPIDPPASQPGPENPNGIGGVGIAFRQNKDGDWIVEQIKPGSPAAKAGLKPGGALVAVDGKSVDEMNFDHIRQLVTGKIGTPVKLSITEVMDVILIRADVSGAAPPPQPMPGPGPMPGGDQRPAPQPGPGGQLPHHLRLDHRAGAR